MSDITNNSNTFNIDFSPSFGSDFVFFAWGSSKLKTKEIKEYAKHIFLKSKNENKKVLYISPNDIEKSEKLLSFYHPLGGHWKSDKRERFNGMLFSVFDKLKLVENFE